MPESIWVEVEENANCEYMPLMVYEAHQVPAEIREVVLEELGRPHGLHRVTGWSSDHDGSPCPALYAPVSDSGQAVVHLVYGGDWGIRLKPSGSDEDWDLNSSDQWGEPYLMLTDAGAIVID